MKLTPRLYAFAAVLLAAIVFVAINIAALVEKAAITEATAKDPAPQSKSFRRPIRSPKAPIGISAPATKNP